MGYHSIDVKFPVPIAIPEEILAIVAVAGIACYRACKGKSGDFNSHDYPTAATDRRGHSAGIWNGDLYRQRAAVPTSVHHVSFPPQSAGRGRYAYLDRGRF